MSRPFCGKSTGIGLMHSRHFPSPVNICHSPIIDSNPSLNSNEKSPILLNHSHHYDTMGTVPLAPTMNSRLSSLSKTIERPISEDEICVLNDDPRQIAKANSLRKGVTPTDFYLKQDDSSNDPRRRTFSLGNASWLTKPFRKLSFNSINRHRNSASKSVPGYSSLDCEESVKKSHDCMGRKQMSTCSFASYKHNSDSIELDKASLNSSQSITNSTTSNSSNLLSSRLLSSAIRRKIEKIPTINGDLVELDFAPNSTMLTTRSCISDKISGSLDNNLPISNLRGRTFSVGAKKMSNHESLKGSFCDISEFPTSKSALFNTMPASNKYSEDAYMDERRLKPSEALIRKHCGVTSASGANSARKKKAKSSGDFPLKDVQCYFSPTDLELLQALTTGSSSAHHNSNQKSFSIDSFNSNGSEHFETIEENASEKSTRATSRTSLLKGATTNYLEKSVPEEDEYVF